MGRRRYSPSDPTANTAIGNADGDRKRAAGPRQRQGRRLLAEFPDIFNGLLPGEAKAVALHAHQLAGNDVWAITGEHLSQARAALA